MSLVSRPRLGFSAFTSWKRSAGAPTFCYEYPTCFNSMLRSSIKDRLLAAECASVGGRPTECHRKVVLRLAISEGDAAILASRLSGPLLTFLRPALHVAELLSRRFDRGLPPMPEAVQRLALLLEEPNVELLVAHTDVAGELHHLPLDLGVVVVPDLLETVHVLARSVHNGHQGAPNFLGELLPELREIGVVRALSTDI